MTLYIICDIVYMVVTLCAECVNIQDNYCEACNSGDVGIYYQVCKTCLCMSYQNECNSSNKL